jgi:hypothetical protein
MSSWPRPSIAIASTMKGLARRRRRRRRHTHDGEFDHNALDFEQAGVLGALDDLKRLLVVDAAT